MKIAVLSFSLLLSSIPLLGQRYTAPPDVPAVAVNPEFPVHVRILQSRWNYVRGDYQGYGRGDLLGDKPIGFDYTYSCSEPFLHNAQRGEFYQARWKKPDETLELLMQKVGSDHEQKCQLKVALKPEPYGHYGPAPTGPPPATVGPPAPPPASPME